MNINDDNARRRRIQSKYSKEGKTFQSRGSQPGCRGILEYFEIMSPGVTFIDILTYFRIQRCPPNIEISDQECREAEKVEKPCSNGIWYSPHNIIFFSPLFFSGRWIVFQEWNQLNGYLQLMENQSKRLTFFMFFPLGRFLGRKTVMTCLRSNCELKPIL